MVIGSGGLVEASGLRGLGRAIAFGLASKGHSVVSVGHIDTDLAEIEVAET